MPLPSAVPSRAAAMLRRLLVGAAALPAVAAAQPGGPAASPPAPTLALQAVPELVGAGVISTAAAHEFAPTLTPDGRTLIFAVTDLSFSRMTLVESRLQGATWGAPTVLPFSGRWNDGDGALSPDGTRFVYISNRPLAGDTATADLNLWEVTRTADGRWGEPRPLPASINLPGVNEVYPSLAADGTLYFGRAGADRPLFRAARSGDGYAEPERLPFGGFSLAIAPDQRFAIVGSPGATPTDLDLHVVYRQDGTWGAPQRLTGPVNSTGGQDLAAWISADARTLWFVSARRGDPIRWPRATALRTMADVRAEMDASVHNGLRNVWRVDISELSGAAPAVQKR